MNWFDPVAFYVWHFPIRWYALSWAVSFLFMLYVPSHLVKRSPKILSYWHDIVTNALIISIIGGRLGEMLIFQHDQLFADPLSLVKIWQGGMSFHGAMLCGTLSFVWMSRYYQINFWKLSDAAVVHLPVTFILVRLANFINGELCGRVTSSSWGVVNPKCGIYNTYPSQLFEAFGEGVVLWAIVYFISKKINKTGITSMSFLAGYAIIRFIIETFFRAPTYELTQAISSGQILCLIMLSVTVLMSVSCWKN